MSPRILIVDDEETIREVCGRTLRAEGVEVALASSDRKSVV